MADFGVVAMSRPNLSPESMPWADDIEARLDALEAQQTARDGALRGDIRRATRSWQAVPQVLSFRSMLTAPGDQMIADTWTVKVPEGVRTAYVSPPTVNVRSKFIPSMVAGMWWVWVDTDFPEFDSTENIFNDPLSSTQMYVYAFNPSDWRVNFQYAFNYAPVDVRGRSSFDIDVWCLSPSAVSMVPIMDIEYLYTVLWSFEGISKWGA